jgi:hypothetical protein
MIKWFMTFREVCGRYFPNPVPVGQAQEGPKTRLRQAGRTPKAVSFDGQVSCSSGGGGRVDS